MGMFLKMNQNEFNGHYSKFPKHLWYLIAPNGMVIAMGQPEIENCLKFLECLEEVDSNLGEVTDIWCYEIKMSIGDRLVNFIHEGKVIETLRDVDSETILEIYRKKINNKLEIQ